jgi:SPP1 family predicted phage head-tail adaptor
VLTKDERGQDRRQWQTVGRPWAKVEMVSSTEAVESLQTTSKTTWTVTLRWRPDITTKDRIEYDDGYHVHTLSIVALIDKYQQREALELTCVEHE